MDSNGNVLWRKKFVDYSFGERLGIEYIYEYDDKGTQIREITKFYDRDRQTNEMLLGSVYEDEYFAEYKDGKLVRYGQSPPYVVYEYYEDGSLKKESYEQLPGRKDTFYKEYYPGGKGVKRYFSHDKYYMDYYEDGGVAKMVNYDDIYEAKYDKKDKYGNWTRVIVYKNGQPAEYGERTIIYYD